jgi:hypothetical protein
VEQFVRTVVFVKPAYFVIWDRIKSSASAHWVIHTTATDFEWGEHQVRCLIPMALRIYTLAR